MLFRPEALAGQQQAWLGSIQLLRPLSLKLLTAAAVGSVVLVGVFLCSAEYSRKARVGGYLVPDRGVLRITAPQSATVLARRVSEGQQVRAGDILFELSLDSATGLTGEGVAQSLVEREASLRDALQQLEHQFQQQKLGIERRLAAQQGELEAADKEAGAHRERRRLAREELARAEALRAQGFYSDAQLQARRRELLDTDTQALTLEREREKLRTEQAALRAERDALPLRLTERRGELTRELASLRALGLETEAKRRLVLRAPSDGIVSTLQAEPGQPVTPALALASLLPADTRMQAYLYAPSSAVGFVRPDQAVRLRYQAYPYQKFGHQEGRVLQVSRTPLPAAELAALPLGPAANGNEPLYRITVALQRQSVAAYGAEQPLAVGMQLDADVLLEKRRLIEWIFEPLLALAHRV